MASTVLGIDQSLNSTGACILQGANVSLYLIKPKKLSGTTRLLYIKSKVEELIMGYHPDMAVIEGYNYGAAGNNVFDLGELGGVLKTLLVSHEIPAYAIPPASLKKFAGVKNHTKKELMVKAAAKHGLNTDSDDLADAFFLALIAQTLTGDRKTGVRKELEVIRDAGNRGTV